MIILIILIIIYVVYNQLQLKDLKEDIEDAHADIAYLSDRMNIIVKWLNEIEEKISKLDNNKHK